MPTENQSSAHVEYRFLQVILSELTGDRLTVLLVHWDGETLRVCANVPRLPYPVGSIAQIKHVVKRLVKRATAPKGHEGFQDGFGLRLPVSLRWSDIRVEEVPHPDKHFVAMRTALHLRRPPEKRYLGPLMKASKSASVTKPSPVST